MSSGWWEKKLGSTPAAPPPAVRPPDRTLPRLPEQTPRNAPSIQVTPDNFAEASTHWQGSQAAREGTGMCPNCGSDLFFSRSNTGTVMSDRGMAAPAPRCYACGFTPGREMQGAPPA